MNVPDPPTKAMPPPQSRFRNPRSVFYVPPWLSLRWTGGGRNDRTWPFVVEVPLLVVSTVWLALRLVLIERDDRLAELCLLYTSDAADE